MCSLNNMNLKVITLFFVFVASAVQAKATSFSDQLSGSDQVIYDETIAICKSSHSLIRIVLNKNTMDSFLISTGQSLSLVFGGAPSADVVNQSIRQNLLSDYTFDRLQSQGFIRAVRMCFPNNADLQSAFVLSMMTADTLGKVPSIVSMLYIARVSSSVWLKFALGYPRLALTLKVVGPIATTLLTVIDVKRQMASRELTEFERQRVNMIAEGIRQGTEASKALVIEMAEDQIKVLENELKTAQTEQQRKQILEHIQRIKNSLEKLRQV